MTNNENKSKLERKLDIYRYLFAHGNESPTEQQVEIWIEYLDKGLEKSGWGKTEKLSASEKVKRKKDLLRTVGLPTRAKRLDDALTRYEAKPQLTGIDKYIKQMEIRAREYISDISEEGALLRVLIHDYIMTQNPDVLIAVKSLRSFQPIRGLVGENFPEVLFDIEQLAHIGRVNQFYGVSVSKEGYR